MTDQRDPFELLLRFVDPEPDAVIMNATIAQSREAFVRRHNNTPRRPGLAVWLRQSVSLLAPAAMGTVAIVAVIVAAPSLLRTPPTAPVTERVADAPSVTPPASSNETVLSRGDNQSADAAPSDIGPANGGTRMGMQPGPQQPGGPPPQVISTFQGSNVRIGLRLSTMSLELYLPDISGEATIDNQALFAGERLEVLEAFRMEERDIVAIRFRATESLFWRIYRPVDGVYARDMELSALVADATDQDDVESRLSAD